MDNLVSNAEVEERFQSKADDGLQQSNDMGGNIALWLIVVRCKWVQQLNLA